MFQHPDISGSANPLLRRQVSKLRTTCFLWSISLVLIAGASSVSAAILWSDLGSTLVHQTGPGNDILGGALKRNNSSSDTLYFKLHLDPLSDVSTEEYLAAFQLFEGDEARLGIGNSLKAWAYSAMNTSATGESNKVAGDFDLHSSRPESAGLGAFFNYELPRHGIERTIVFKVQFVRGDDDLVTVWLNPDLAPGSTEESQPAAIITRFPANASFNEIHLRHMGGGGGWTFSEMAIANSFDDFVETRSVEVNDTARWTFQTWQREQGLPQNSVRALAQTRDNYIWIGTDDGLARFDGLRFVPAGLREGLPSGPVSKLFEDSHSRLWIGTVGGGLSCREGTRFITYKIRDGLPSDSITAISEDSEGRLWIGTEAGLVILENERLTTLAAAEEFKGKAVTTLFRDGRGTVWIGIKGAGVFHFLAGKFMPVADPAADDLLKDSHCVLVDQGVRIWIGVGDDFVLCRDGDEWRRYRIPRHLARPYVSTLVEGSDGSIWAGSVSEGLFQFKNGKLIVFNANNGLADNFVESLLVDRDGSLWVGTGGGLNRLRRGNLAVLGQNEGLGYGAVQGLAEISTNLIWAGKPSDGLYQWAGRNFDRLSADLSRRFPEVNSLLITRDGSCWVAGGRGLLHFPNPQTNSEAAIEQTMFTDVNVVSLAEGQNGGVWAGTHEGQLWLMRNGTWALQTGFVQPHVITAITQDADGSLWLGTEGGGIYQFKDKILKHIEKNDRLLSNLIRTLYRDKDNVLWIGTGGGGLSRLDKGRIDTITSREGLPDNTISQILEDDTGRLWLGSNRGIACVRKRDLEELANGKMPTIYPRVYGRADGMPSEECTGGFFPAGLKTKSGLLWFSTLKGIVVVNPQLNATELPAPKVVLEDVLVDGVANPGFRERSASGPFNKPPIGDSKSLVVQIPPGRHRFEFRYTGPVFNAPERVRFRYQLEGFDPEWIEAGTSRSAIYNYVPPGEYRFKAIACNSEGVWRNSGATVSFRILPHFWQTWWFMTLAILSAVAVIGSAFRYAAKRNLQRRLAQLEQAHALERERSRIAQDLHDDLGSSLARISLLSGLVRADKEYPAQVETHAQRISVSANQTVRALEEIVWAVRPDSDTLQSLVEYIAHFANELFEDGETRCRLDLPHDLPDLSLPPEVRHNIFLIVKEVLTNALKHAAAREVRVQTKAEGNTIEIIVEDDGKGFALTSEPMSKRNGLTNIQKRVESIGGKLDVKSSVGTGTRVHLVVQIPQGANSGRT